MITPSRQSKYKYEPDKGECVFADGTRYSVGEMVFIAKQNMSDEEMDALHLVKNVFDATIIRKVRKGPSRALLSPFNPDDELTKMGRILNRTNPIEKVEL